MPQRNWNNIPDLLRILMTTNIGKRGTEILCGWGFVMEELSQ